MPTGYNPHTTSGLFHFSQNLLRAATDQCAQGDLNDAVANLAMGVEKLSEALQTALTQMSQDIAALKADVDSLKAKPTPGFHPGSLLRK
jgi:hypothetical protein